MRTSRRGSPVFMWLSAEGLLRDGEDDIMLKSLLDMRELKYEKNLVIL